MWFAEVVLVRFALSKLGLRALRSVREKVSQSQTDAGEFIAPSCRLIGAAFQGQRLGPRAIGGEQKRFMGKQARRNRS